MIKKYGKFAERKSFSKVKEVLEVKDLLNIQKESYNEFLEKGVQEVFDDILPIESYTGNMSLEFSDYYFEEPKYTIRKCVDRNLTYSAPLKVKARLFIHETGEVKEQEVFLGDTPLMTNSGSFIINGIERVVQSQLVRSPSIYFKREIDKNGRPVVTGEVIPNKGAWLEYEIDARDVAYVRIDRTRKLPITTLLRALGLSSDDDIISMMGDSQYMQNTLAKDTTKNTDEALIEVYEKLRPGEPATLDSAKNQLNTKFFDRFRYDLAKVGRYKHNKKLFVLERVLGLTLAKDIKYDAEILLRVLENETKDIENEDQAFAKKLEILIKHIKENQDMVKAIEILTKDKKDSKNLLPKIVKILTKDLKVTNTLLLEKLDKLKKDIKEEDSVIDILTKFITLEVYEEYVIQNKTEKTEEKEGKTVTVVLKKDEILTNNIKYEDQILLEKGEILTETNIEKLRPYFTIDKAVNSGKKSILKKGEILTKSNIDMLRPYFKEGLNLTKVKINDEIDVYNDESEENVYNKVQEIFVYDKEDKEKVVRLIGNNPCSDILRITTTDMYASMNYYFNLLINIGNLDEVDHLGNRRVRQVGELVQNQFKIGLTRMDKTIREKMTTQDVEEVTPKSLINIKPLTAVIKEFFGSSQLSNFLEQVNPLSELTSKRRLTSLGPGGLMRDRAGMVVRDVNVTHYGRICPIESPEGPNIGLITSLSLYAKINEYGFVTTPYQKVKDKKILDEIVYLTADEESNYNISQATIEQKDGKIVEEEVVARANGLDIMVKAEDVDFLDVSPEQIISVSTGCIPFLAHDDTSRALMGSNMQRQAIPLLQADSPIVGTGIEYTAAKYSGAVVLAKASGVVEYVDAHRIVVKAAKGKETYYLSNYLKSNNKTTINQKPIVKKGDKVTKDMIIADGPSTDNGELALGKNLTVAFMPFDGYNYEDAIILSERLVKEDILTSVHIRDFEIDCRDTKLGPEEITRDIPNVSEEARKNLDINGIIKIGTEVSEGDILVGKVTPKGVQELTSEEKLLHAIFGEKTREVRDTSLRVNNGADGIIHDIKVFTKENTEGLPAGVLTVVRVYIAQKRKIQVGDKMAGRHGNKGVVSLILPEEDLPYMEDGTPVDMMLNPQGIPSRMNLGQVLELHLGMAGKKLGLKYATPSLAGATVEEVKAEMEKADIPSDGKFTLYDGRSGRKFDNNIAVGMMYMLKLDHMVEDKIHARSTGPYSLVTQQPLGGKAQFGGQRFGEMEVWALYAYGAANILQELITIKSDDIVGRVKVYEALVKGKTIPDAGVPESFRVLIREFQAIGLDVEITDAEGSVHDLKKLEELDLHEEVPIRVEEVEIQSKETEIDSEEEGGK